MSTSSGDSHDLESPGMKKKISQVQHKTHFNISCWQREKSSWKSHVKNSNDERVDKRGKEIM